MENNRKMLNAEEAAQVTGGVHRKINTGVDGLDAALRKEARKGSKQIGHIPNGTIIDTITDELVYDPESGRNFVQVLLDDGRTGWVAASIIGMKR
ncbi:MAG: SH3 domain-containing protein [Clostridia bacterium]|nr:SH3 domain-containing protein [Clostridia bacterium]